MFLRIEKGSAVPISRQIAEQIATLCASGSLQPGDRLPSVRELARELAVNQNTILRVYERLVGEGLTTDELHELLAEAASGVEQPVSATNEEPTS
jgi:GntR family transcriptional regulator